MITVLKLWQSIDCPKTISLVRTFPYFSVQYLTVKYSPQAKTSSGGYSTWVLAWIAYKYYHSSAPGHDAPHRSLKNKTFQRKYKNNCHTQALSCCLRASRQGFTYGGCQRNRLVPCPFRSPRPEMLSHPLMAGAKWCSNIDTKRHRFSPDGSGFVSKSATLS